MSNRGLQAEPRSLVGERANPDPAQRKAYIVEVIEQVEGEVCVRYIAETDGDPWWITEAAWEAWKKWTT